MTSTLEEAVAQWVDEEFPNHDRRFKDDMCASMCRTFRTIQRKQNNIQKERKKARVAAHNAAIREYIETHS